MTRPADPLFLHRRIALVTGAARGIGAATARAFARAGARVALLDRDADALERTAAAVGAAGADVLGFTADVADTEAVASVVERLVREWGRVDVLVNNAGHSSKARNVRWVPQDEWDAVVNVNLTGVYALTQAVLPSMIARGGGTIITVSSLAALKPGLIGGAPYGAAKAGVRNLMGHVHTVLREKGIRATTIMPAEVDTPILDNRPLVPDDKARATMMQAEDVARAILLCVTLPARTVIEEIVMSPTILRDQSADLRTARDLGATPNAP
jgi:NADP-dependent 3-hydroxy acid dehydrogenase YdfG